MKQIDLDVPKALENVISNIEKEGGKSYLVGGAIIDTLQNRQVKDWDIEVYNINLTKLIEVLSTYSKSKSVGKSFGIVKVKIEGKDYDFSVPRKENKVGLGHKDFEVELVPNITLNEAAYRRDLTINSMFIDLNTKEIFDPYNGLEDLENGILRHTSDKFSEDPLRVLRIMQLLPRKGKTVARETMELCRNLSNQYHTIDKERVEEEWNKLLMKSDKPSKGLQFLVDSGWIRHYPELEVLMDTEQNPDWHPEGNVWNHTKLVLNYAASQRDYLPDEWKKAYMYGVLLHDVGKAVTTTEDLKAYGHDKAGIPIAKEFMKRITNNKDLIEKTTKIVEYHMRPNSLIKCDSKESAWKRLHNNIPLNVIAYVSKADSNGILGKSAGVHKASEKALRLFETYGEGKIPQVVNGRDLISLGYKPGPEFGKILKKAYDLQIEEGIMDKQAILEKIRT